MLRPYKKLGISTTSRRGWSISRSLKTWFSRIQIRLPIRAPDKVKPEILSKCRKACGLCFKRTWVSRNLKNRGQKDWLCPKRLNSEQRSSQVRCQDLSAPSRNSPVWPSICSRCQLTRPGSPAWLSLWKPNPGHEEIMTYTILEIQRDAASI